MPALCLGRVAKAAAQGGLKIPHEFSAIPGSSADSTPKSKVGEIIKPAGP